jgi:hypothetical protein
VSDLSEVNTQTGTDYSQFKKAILQRTTVSKMIVFFQYINSSNYRNPMPAVERIEPLPEWNAPISVLIPLDSQLGPYQPCCL